MTARRVVGLVLSLPRESRAMTSLKDPDDRSLWDLEQTLLGLVVERLDALHGTLVKVNGGRVRGKLPQIVPRPKPKKRRPGRRVSTESALASLDKAIAAVGGDG